MTPDTLLFTIETWVPKHRAEASCRCPGCLALRRIERPMSAVGPGSTTGVIPPARRWCVVCHTNYTDHDRTTGLHTYPDGCTAHPACSTSPDGRDTAHWHDAVDTPLLWQGAD